MKLLHRAQRDWPGWDLSELRAGWYGQNQLQGTFDLKLHPVSHAAWLTLYLRQVPAVAQELLR